MIKRVLVEKNSEFNEEHRKLISIISKDLKINTVKELRIINCYDVSGLSDNEMKKAEIYVFSEKNADKIVDSNIIKDYDFAFRIKPLPGQFDQRGDSAKQCINLILVDKEKLEVESSKVILINGDLSNEEILSIKKYLINPVEMVEVSTKLPKSIGIKSENEWFEKYIEKFSSFNKEELMNFKEKYSLAMTINDLIHIKNYFNEEKRNPSLTEIKVLDTYWSDHCRHTTFMTKINNVEFEDLSNENPVLNSFKNYIDLRKKVYLNRDKNICLMDLATISAKYHKLTGELDQLDISEEINACSVNAKVLIDGKEEDYLIMYKNETHNHPTEIEPFGGASTCLGGAIRDPLSGRAYVYQGMRVTGSADPRERYEDTLDGKLPQKKITKEAAHGFSSYGNQIGMATGEVREYYDDGFKAKRMEVGAVIAAAPKKNVVREEPRNGDKILLIGGRTGRDGIGGATGSSKSHSEDSIKTSGAEVQKGNPPEERKIQRLFRNFEATKLIKRCNDFGAGGVSVAVGELADSIDIYLERVPKKYDGLTGMEIAISESQERMAVVVASENVDEFMKLLENENIEGTVIAEVTNSKRLRMFYNDQKILDISRDFLETNGASSETDAIIEKINYRQNPLIFSNLNKDKSKKKINELSKAENDESILAFEIKKRLSDINIASQKGLMDIFDSTIGAGTVLMPYGGKTYNTKTQGMVAKIPLLKGNTSTVTIMTHGYNPKIGKWSTYHGGYYSVVESIAKIVAMGGKITDTTISLQEYFRKLGKDKKNWGLPLSGLLGTIEAQIGLGISAIGGKDSMSGTFKDINVPSTIISFAVATSDVSKIISPELKSKESVIYKFNVNSNEKGLKDITKLKSMYQTIEKLSEKRLVKSAYSVSMGGTIVSLMMMSLGNKIGFEINKNISLDELLNEDIGSILVEVNKDINIFDEINKEEYREIDEVNNFEVLEIAKTNEYESLTYKNMKISIDEATKIWEKPLEEIFPTKYELSKGEEENEKLVDIKSNFSKNRKYKSKIKIDKPRVVIPIFPGTNCEWDTMRAFEKAGASVKLVNIKNLNSELFKESIIEFEKEIKNANIIALAGGFSAGDEPDGSGKFIASLLRNPIIEKAIMKHIKEDDGLIIGICNGFQALIKTGLLPYGEIRELGTTTPTLTFNRIGRHISEVLNTKIVSNASPWLMNDSEEDIFTTPVSHGEGRFYAKGQALKELIDNSQIATVYSDSKGKIINSQNVNPNGSVLNVEGLISKDGRIFGKMGHMERVDNGLYKNITNIRAMRIFESGVKYFTHK
ncbi:phosphoribosylformylglycinamidine synthase [Helicovermis profundi]|uniref:Phosphoribosylformylglycinamidine synthase n=2 Tax=Helicovermis profundi TaxID=3065157 RepID=A0AAU9EG64_9FIRM|nr:phosphoribosylformylglycinamidine synthase [Clostridia bacterium S502]